MIQVGSSSILEKTLDIQSETGATIILIHTNNHSHHHCNPSEECSPDGNTNPCAPTDWCNPDEGDDDDDE